MPSQSRRKSTAIKSKLHDAPYEYPFVQAVRLLMREAYKQAQATSTEIALDIAQYTPPQAEVIRFQSNWRLSFPASEVYDIVPRRSDGNNKNAAQWNMIVSFLGLSGSSGVLPYHYSELIIQQIKDKNPAIFDFLEMFNHRTISLFYRASIKYRCAHQYEQSQYKRKTVKRSDMTHALLSIIGLGTKGLTDRMITPDECLLHYSGLYSQKVRNPTSLGHMLSDYFNLPIKIGQFQGQWQNLVPDLRSHITSKALPKGQNVCLGINTLIGSKGWYAQGKIQINIGPLSKTQFNSVKPGSSKLTAIKEIVRLYVGIEQDFELNIKLKRSDLGERVTLQKHNKPILAWNSWMEQSQTQQAGDDMINIRLSSRIE